MTSQPLDCSACVQGRSCKFICRGAVGQPSAKRRRTWHSRIAKSRIASFKTIFPEGSYQFALTFPTHSTVFVCLDSRCACDDATAIICPQSLCLTLLFPVSPARSAGQRADLAVGGVPVASNWHAGVFVLYLFDMFSSSLFPFSLFLFSPFLDSLDCLLASSAPSLFMIVASLFGWPWGWCMMVEQLLQRDRVAMPTELLYPSRGNACLASTAF